MTKYEELTPREKQVIEAIKQGYISNEAIAMYLKVTKNTVVTHIQNIYEKLQIDGKCQRATLVYRLLSEIMAEMVKECLSMGILL